MVDCSVAKLRSVAGLRLKARESAGKLTMGNNGHVPDIGRLVHERTNLHAMSVSVEIATSSDER